MKKIRRRTISVFFVAALGGAALLHVSQNVQQAEDELAKYERSYDAQREAIRVLNAEWTYLNSPARLESLARDHLDMQAPNSDQMMPDTSILPRVDVPTPAPFHSDLYKNISQSDANAAAEDVPYVPPPRRKPKSQNGDFRALLKDVGKGGAP